ncbi:mannosyl-3-phosphoglycerate phosphatase-related protein [Musicola paradisiaca]|uniref:Mannosyl-3-phosphoglycerate phosphatase family n=1 Tax=Musicola paradisiaca (strain Ech703) TaxID=579405 RepID=C6C570_MUSP7|nr:mannosyl-3-phosphoglycerate phosphatase-related protein [Musicola paradisiaca]ACS85680.1 mannosyl-3-phosphoglycerate phosphatase family [Musicola paradisiaca Ech703]
MPGITSDWMIFTDLDGSLLDHHSYDWSPAAEWLARLKAHHVPVVMTSSKTAAELCPLQQKLGLDGAPFIAENGAAITLPADWNDHPAFPQHVMATDYQAICRCLQELRAHHRFAFTGFADMDATQVAQATGLSQPLAALARQRLASEPLIWQDSAEAMAEFVRCLAHYQLALTEGGRFCHVMSHSVSKGAAVHWLLSQYRQREERLFFVIGLGDGPNDISLLEAMDYAVVIRGYVSDKVTLSPEFQGRYYRTQQTGPAGWREGLDHIALSI